MHDLHGWHLLCLNRKRMLELRGGYFRVSLGDIRLLKLQYRHLRSVVGRKCMQQLPRGSLFGQHGVHQLHVLSRG